MAWKALREKLRETLQTEEGRAILGDVVRDEVKRSSPAGGKRALDSLREMFEKTVLPITARHQNEYVRLIESGAPIHGQEVEKAALALRRWLDMFRKFSEAIAEFETPRLRAILVPGEVQDPSRDVPREITLAVFDADGRQVRGEVLPPEA